MKRVLRIGVLVGSLVSVVVALVYLPAGASIPAASAGVPYSSSFEAGIGSWFANSSGNADTCSAGSPSLSESAEDGTHVMTINLGTAFGTPVWAGCSFVFSVSASTTYTFEAWVYQAANSKPVGGSGWAPCPSGNDVVCGTDGVSQSNGILDGNVTPGTWSKEDLIFTTSATATVEEITLLGMETTSGGTVATDFDNVGISTGGSYSGGSGGSGGVTTTTGPSSCTNCATASGQAAGNGLLGSIFSGIGSVVSGIGGLASSIVSPIVSALSTLGSSIVSGLQSVFQFLFVPSSSTTSGFSTMWADFKTKVPTSIFYDAVALIPTTISGIQSGLSSGSTCTVSTGGSGDATIRSALRPCAIAGVLTTGSFSDYTGMIRDVLLFIFLSGLTYGLFRVVGQTLSAY